MTTLDILSILPPWMKAWLKDYLRERWLLDERVDVQLLQCQLSEDSGLDMVCDGIRGCLMSKVLSNRVEAVTMLLEANPQAAHHVNNTHGHGETLAHVACFFSGKMPPQDCINILKLLLVANKDAFKAVVIGSGVREWPEREMAQLDQEGVDMLTLMLLASRDTFAMASLCKVNGWLPVHVLARDGTVEALEYLLDACPEVPATTLTRRSAENLLHCIAQGRNNAADQAAKARLLCSRYPVMMMQRDYQGWTPLHTACNSSSSSRADIVMVLCEAGGRELASAPVIHATDPDQKSNGWLPLHGLIYGSSDRLREEDEESLLPPFADAFRTLLRLYPEAASVKACTDGYEMYIRRTPYELAYGFPTYYRRLLLRAAPGMDPEKLRRLNWAERRTAMYVAYAATFPKGTKPALLARFRLENPDMVKHVVSFL